VATSTRSFNITGADIVARVRIQTAEPNPRRWTDAYLLQLINDAQRAISLRLDFPRETMTIPTVVDQREYQVTELVKIWAVYIQSPDGSQQELYGTDISTLQGDLLQQYDNTSGTQVGAPIQSPQWLTQAPQLFPVASTQIGGWVPTKLPYQNNVQNSAQRPCYYLRGGYIGVLPPPSTNTSTINIDCVPKPPDLQTLQNASIFPDTFINALKWKVVADCRDADNDAQGSMKALQQFEAELAQNNLQVERLQATNPKIYVPLTIRRTTGGWCDWWD
jgi:hypothetical protein